MDEQQRQAYFRLMAHEYALEAITATMLNFMPLESAEKWIAEFKEKCHRVSLPGNPDIGDVDATRLVHDGVELIEHFADKVLARVRGAHGQ